MTKIIVKNLYKAFQERLILNNLSFEIGDNNKLGLVGENGIGKSTLKNILTGKITDFTGSLNFIPPNITLGIIDEDLSFASSHKSGGESTKTAIQRVLQGSYDFFILDEPTNHLDISGIQWLEKLIKSINKPMVIISHDRRFLDEVTNKTAVLSKDDIRIFQGNYSFYQSQIANEKAALLKKYSKQQQEIRSLEENIRQRKDWFNKAHKAAGQNDHLRALSKKHISVMKSKEKKLEKLKESEVRLSKEPRSINLKLNNNNTFKTALRITNLCKSFGKKELLKDINFTIKAGDKVGIIGNNGVGKTTLLNLILNKDKNYSGNIYINESMKISSFSQSLNEMPLNLSILNYLKSTMETENNIRLILGSVLIKGERVNTSISSLSMGEKCRVAFAKIILENPDLIILDEPTNYMDILSRERIELLLESFIGTVIIVSHDRHLISSVCSRILLIQNKTIVDFEGSSDEIATFFTSMRDVKVKNSLKDISKDELLLLQCRLSELGGLLAGTNTKEVKEEYEKEFLEISKKIRSL